MACSILADVPSLLALDATSLQLRILPLECSIDTLSTGTNNLTQISPETCIDEPPVAPQTPHAPIPPLFIPSRPFDHIMRYPLKTGYESARPLHGHETHSTRPGDTNDHHEAARSSRRVSDYAVPSLFLALITAVLLSPFIIRGVKRLLHSVIRYRHY